MTKIALFLLTACFATGLRAQTSPLPADPTRTSFSVAVGASMPIGAFANRYPGAAARPGAVLSAEIAAGGSTAWISSLLLSYNPTEASTTFDPEGSEVAIKPWWTLWPMTGLAWRAEVSPAVSLELIGQVGLFVGISPSVTVRYPPYPYASISSDRALAVSAGAGAGVTVSDRCALKVRYIFADPRYDRTFTDLGSSVTAREDQPTSLFVMTLGWTW